jgi:hypothetical protein
VSSCFFCSLSLSLSRARAHTHTHIYIYIWIGVFTFILLYFSILLHCIVQWVLQVMFPSACSFIVLVFTVSLHVSAYVAIFTCIGYFIFICLKDSASLFFLPFFHVVTLCVFPPVFFLCFPSLFLLFPCVCVCLLASTWKAQVRKCLG